MGGIEEGNERAPYLSPWSCYSICGPSYHRGHANVCGLCCCLGHVWVHGSAAAVGHVVVHGDPCSHRGPCGWMSMGCDAADHVAVWGPVAAGGEWLVLPLKAMQISVVCAATRNHVDDHGIVIVLVPMAYISTGDRAGVCDTCGHQRPGSWSMLSSYTMVHDLCSC